MKQKRLLGLALASLLVLSGCSSSAVKEDGKYVVASIDGKNILADDIYEKLSSSTAGKDVYKRQRYVSKNFPTSGTKQK